LICDGLTGLPDAITTVWPKAITQTCVVHLLRNSFRYSGRQHWAVIANALKPVYTAPTEAAARERFAEFTEAWGGRYPAIVRLWDNAWAEFVPFLAFGPEIRRVICSTNAIESVNARIRRAVKARGHFPNEQAALKCVYMAIMSLDPTGLLHGLVTSELACRDGELGGCRCAQALPSEFRDDVVRVSRHREPGVTVEQIAKDFGCTR
jgi:putative transposase